MVKYVVHTLCKLNIQNVFLPSISYIKASRRIKENVDAFRTEVEVIAAHLLLTSKMTNLRHLNNSGPSSKVSEFHMQASFLCETMTLKSPKSRQPTINIFQRTGSWNTHKSSNILSIFRNRTISTRLAWGLYCTKPYKGR